MKLTDAEHELNALLEENADGAQQRAANRLALADGDQLLRHPGREQCPKRVNAHKAGCHRDADRLWMDDRRTGRNRPNE